GEEHGRRRRQPRGQLGAVLGDEIAGRPQQDEQTGRRRQRSPSPRPGAAEGQGHPGKKRDQTPKGEGADRIAQNRGPRTGRYLDVCHSHCAVGTLNRGILCQFYGGRNRYDSIATKAPGVRFLFRSGSAALPPAFPTARVPMINMSTDRAIAWCALTRQAYDGQPLSHSEQEITRASLRQLDDL